jgi:hypothetical protein
MRSPRPSPLGVVAALLLLAAPARAQVADRLLFGEKLSSPTFNMGFEVGANFSTVTGFEDAERTNRTAFGLFADWPGRSTSTWAARCCRSRDGARRTWPPSPPAIQRSTARPPATACIGASTWSSCPRS